MPLPVSVVLPTYDGERYLADALASVAAQADPDVEVVIADDGSTDGTLAIAGRFAERLRLRVLTRPHDGNWVRGTNIALAESRGDYVSFLHQDDAWKPGRLAQVRAAAAGRDLVLHATELVDAAGRALGRWTCPLPAGVVPAVVLQQRLAVQNAVGLPSVTFRRELAPALDESLWFTADWDLWGRLAARGPSVVHLPAALAQTRLHPGAQTSVRTSDVAEVRRQVQRVQSRVLDDLGRPPALVRAAAFNAEVTATLAALVHRRPLAPGALLASGLRLGPAGLAAFLRSARLVERGWPRLRVLARG